MVAATTHWGVKMSSLLLRRSRRTVMIQLSVYDQARKAVQEHKWLESEKAGRDLGHAAVWEWTKSYWLRFYRWRFLQHLRGDIFWQEFATESFGLVNGRLWAPPKLLDEILDHVRN